MQLGGGRETDRETNDPIFLRCPTCAGQRRALVFFLGSSRHLGSSATGIDTLDSSKGVRRHDNEQLCEIMISAFSRAYPDVPTERIQHMARNFVQVVSGMIDIGRRVGREGNGHLSHMDIANSMVFWCISNTRLEDFCEGSGRTRRADSTPVISEEEARLLQREFSARVADWLVGVEALKGETDLYESFIRGSLALGVSDWENNRAELGY